MLGTMKILIGYDGSASSNAMLDDLRRAGLPEKAEVQVVSVAETWFPLPTSFGGVDTGYASESITGVDSAKTLAKHAHEYLQFHFPGWEIEYAAASGSPTSILLGQEENWHPDLIVLGSHGHSAISDLFLGNVSQKVATEAHCSVRVARGKERAPDAPVRLIIGIDGSVGSEAAVKVLAERNWPAKTEVRLVNAIWNLPPPSPDADRHENIALQIAEWVAIENARIKQMVEHSVKKLQEAGLTTTLVVREEDPKRLLISEAESWGADSIFIGARGRSRLERIWLGSVSSTVVMRAPCSVEIVRA